MLVVEGFERAGKPISAQIFATDIDDAIQKARLGRYPDTIAGQLLPARLERFLSQGSDHYEVSPALRAMCLFSLHNVASDPPFSRFDLISSRNLLIYLDNELQARVLKNFHYSLNTGGALFLGAAEAISDQGKLFGTGGQASPNL
jgi:two-component system CheB/CheR fusion protein